MPMEMLQETFWFKLWRTPWGVDFLDSKLRWFGVDLPLAEPIKPLSKLADRFLADFAAAENDGQALNQLEAVFEFYPYELTADIERILSCIQQTDAPRAARMRAHHFTAEQELPQHYRYFTQTLAAHLQAQSTPHSHKLIGDNRWFAVFINDAGLHFDTHVESVLLMPTAAELALLQADPSTLAGLAYQRAIRLVQENPWLLEPPAGAEAIPGLTELQMNEEG